MTVVVTVNATVITNMSGYRADYIEPVEDSMTKFRRMRKRRAWIPSCYYLRSRVGLNAGSWVHVSSNIGRLAGANENSKLLFYNYLFLKLTQ